MPRESSRLPPAQHRFVQVNGIRLHYAEVDTGGTPMVLLHGIGMDWRVWQAISRRLATMFHLYMVDLRGHGESDKPAHGYSPVHYAADVEELVEVLDLRESVLVGSSLGGLVSVVVEAPVDVIAARVLVDPPLGRDEASNAATFERIRSVKIGVASEAEQVVAIRAVLRAGNPGAGTLLLDYMAESWVRAATGVLDEPLERPEEFFQVDSALAYVDSPTLIMRANPALGGVLTEAAARRSAQLLPTSEVLYFPEAGHAIHAYNPQRFVDAIAAFVATSRVADGAPLPAAGGA